MTVAELIKALESESPNRLVILAKDGGGNDHSPLSSGFYTGAYLADTTWRGEVGIEELTDELRQAGFCEEDVIYDGVPALILSPIN